MKKKEKKRKIDMGWTNYIIISELKMIVETNRNVIELEDYIKEAWNKVINDDTSIDISDLKVSNITVQDLCILASAYENISDLYELEIDKFLLYWLYSRNIKYEIETEFKIKLEDYERDGYKIIRICDNYVNQDDHGRYL